MRQLTTMIAGLGLALAPGMLVAQSADASATIEVVPAGNAVVTKTADLNFGAHPACSPPFTCDVRSSDVGTAAAWNITFNEVASYLFTFTLPTELSAASGAQLPIFFGVNAATSPFPFMNTWDPASTLSLFVPEVGMSMDIFLGQDLTGNGSGDVAVDLAGAAPGLYQGVITLTVAAL